MPWQMLRLQRQSAGDHRGRQSDENCTSGPFSGASSHGIVQHTVAEQKSACTSHRPLEQKGTRTPCLAHKPLGVFKRRLRGLVTRSEKRPQKLKIKARRRERAGHSAHDGDDVLERRWQANVCSAVYRAPIGGLPALFKNEDELRALWSEPSTRKALLEGLAEKGFRLGLRATRPDLARDEAAIPPRWCAEYERQLGGGSPLPSPMMAKGASEAQGHHS